MHMRIGEAIEYLHDLADGEKDELGTAISVVLQRMQKMNVALGLVINLSRSSGYDIVEERLVDEFHVDNDDAEFLCRMAVHAYSMDIDTLKL